MTNITRTARTATRLGLLAALTTVLAGCDVPAGLNPGPHTVVYEVLGAERAGNIT